MKLRNFFSRLYQQFAQSKTTINEAVEKLKEWKKAWEKEQRLIESIRSFRPIKAAIPRAGQRAQLQMIRRLASHRLKETSLNRVERREIAFAIRYR